jgi:hypothetical protein
MAESPPSPCRLKNGFMLVVAFTGLFLFISYVKYGSINSCGGRQDFMSAWGCTRQRQTSPATIRVGLSPASMARNETDGLQPVSVASNEAEAGKMYRQIWNEYVNHSHIMNQSSPHCSPPSEFHSWERGKVTQMWMPLKKDCHKLRQNPAQEMQTSNLTIQLKAWKYSRPWQSFALKFKNMSCDKIREQFENNFYVSQIEKNFPIAYILVVYTNAGQVLRLLKSIYRAHNLYCIHPDARQGESFKGFFTAVSKCLDNVFVVSNPVKVYYGHISITDAQLQCMQDLEKYPQSRWRYVINLCGREIPLKTNREIVHSLQQLGGYSAVNAYPLPQQYWKKRFTGKYRLDKNGKNRNTSNKQVKPPEGIKLYKSMNFIAASRSFVHFILNDSVAKEFHEYLTTVYAPDEHFYSSLYALPQAIGAKPPPGLHATNGMPIIDKFIWIINSYAKEHLKELCPGRKVIHLICILTTMELGIIERNGVRPNRPPIFFFNKYFLEWDPVPMDCMEERLVETNMKEYKRDCMPEP